MLKIKQELLTGLAIELEKLSPGAGARAAFESPKVAAHGDLACTAAMQLAKPLKLNPRQLGETLRAALLAQPAYERWVASIDIAGPGFLNIRLKPEAKQQIVHEVLQAGDAFGVQPSNGQRLMVEFVSANPTGPLHVGHGRQAALGDAICSLYQTQGWDVHREFYYNDAGVQIGTLANSTQLRAKGFKPGDPEWPEAAYNGEYIQDIAKDFRDRKTVKADDREFTASGDLDDLDSIRQFAVAYLRHEQDLDLQEFKVKFDHYYLESSLYTSGKVDAAVQKLRDAGKTYEHDGALWLKSTDYGDDKDRVMRKGDGSYTYFVPDVAYHITKWERCFTKVINIQGTDHHGTIARVRAGLQAYGPVKRDDGTVAPIPAGYPDYVLHTMVRVVKGGEEVKISKRAGSYVTLRDLIKWTSRDAVRFFLLSRKPDTEYTFDVDLAVQKNNDNPVYYVQYAHARICSVLEQWIVDELGWPGIPSALENGFKGTLMDSAKTFHSCLLPWQVTREFTTLLANSSSKLISGAFSAKVEQVEKWLASGNFENLKSVISEIDSQNWHVGKHTKKLLDTLHASMSDPKVVKHAEQLASFIAEYNVHSNLVPRIFDKFGFSKLAKADLSVLKQPTELELMLQLAKYPAMLSAAAADFAPHDVTFYLRELAASYHSYYDAERILVDDDEAVKLARLALIQATAQVLHNGLAVLGVSAPQKM